ncbi:beta-hexosaminidase 3-like [Hordeum vulgare subsp. vulgare]|uniref:beta-hexosaminidase 3-like n=1 Tax=Hordeum vulgare subsp. vulgare TaxID=112509 RepID=UPI001D1A54FA|nr:beta-hexosaminidase 3-like [Hordeum vulgare subsp. vulgare]
MMTPTLMRLVLALTAVGCCAARQASGRVDLWPMPASVSRGARMLYIAKDLKLTTAGAGYKDGKAILADAFRRMVAAIQLDHAINGSYDDLPVLAGVNVVVRSPDDEFGVDESYRLTMPSTGSPLYARIEVWC